MKCLTCHDANCVVVKNYTSVVNASLYYHARNIGLLLLLLFRETCRESQARINMTAGLRKNEIHDTLVGYSFPGGTLGSEVLAPKPELGLQTKVFQKEKENCLSR